MTKPTNPQSLKRYQDSIASLFSSDLNKKHDLIFIKSSSDVGVERNGGRNGARLAPQSLLSFFKKLSISGAWKNQICSEFEVADEIFEREHFEDAQKREAAKIHSLIGGKAYPAICHLGGGHDHIKPLLDAVTQDYKKIIVINIDAHADTRTDTQAHSGNPFRLFSEDFKGEFHLFQIGLHSFANSSSTLSPLNKGRMDILWSHELSDPGKIQSYFEQIASLVDTKTVVVFSLDADGLSGHEVPGVSAVNGRGLSILELELLWSHYRKLQVHHRPLLGIYELNPVYDTLSGMSMRSLSSFLYQALV